MQISKLYFPKDIPKANSLECIFNFQQFNYNNQITNSNIINRNYEPLRIFENNIDQDYDNAYTINIDNISNNDKKILFLLKDDLWSAYSFKALERKLEIHQQSLSRALKRLVSMNLVEKTRLGYKLNTKITFTFSSKILEDLLAEEEKEYTTLKSKKAKRGFYQLLQLCIPVKSNIGAIVNHLVGKWFADLRWHGLSKRETGFILQWSASSKHNENNNLFQIQLHIVSEYVVIESNAISDADKICSMLNANKIMAEIIKVMQTNIQKEFTICENKSKESIDNIPKKFVSIVKLDNQYKIKK